MSIETTRRNLMLGSLGAVAAATWTSASGAAMPDTRDDLKLGVASYSLRKLSRTAAIQACKDLNIHYINIKDFHLPLASTPAEIAAARKEFEDAGLKIIGCGNISFQKDDDAEMRHNFEYARALGVPLIVMAPSHQTLPKVEKLVKEFDIKAAIHNHGPEDKHFPTPADVLKAVKDMDPRMGCCIDVGHTARTGADVVESVVMAGPRLFDMHAKDLASFDAKESQVAVGEGKMPIVAIFKQLEKMKYQGGVMLEYEIFADNPVPGMKQSFSYMRGVLAGLHG